MLLPLVGRYLGEDAEGVSEDAEGVSGSHAHSLLLQLQLKAKARQNRSVTEDTQDTPEEHTQKNKLKKKNKCDSQHDKKRTLEEDNLEPPGGGKRKKKRNENSAEGKGKDNIIPGVNYLYSLIIWKLCDTDATVKTT